MIEHLQKRVLDKKRQYFSSDNELLKDVGGNLRALIKNGPCETILEDENGTMILA